MNDVAAAEALLQQQLDDLIRFRDVVEAQRAVLRMADRALLERFAREAEELAATVAGREVRLLTIRRSIQQRDAGREPASIRTLAAQVDRARQTASAEASALARLMESEARELARELEATSRQLAQVLGGYSRQAAPGQPLLINRRG
ncbi:MAG TPA: hypothetical protein PLL69_07445 [Gemmatimonadales bacterium]|nr:hypothetical protein [Gemmatimonadales bacterium]